MKKILIGLCPMLMFSPVLADGAYTSLSYVTNGLIAQWDAIDNAGRGQHDPNASYPVELVKNLPQTLTGTMPAQDVCFELGSGDLSFLSPDIRTAINEGHATVEICLGSNGTRVNNGGIVAFGTETRGFWAWQSTQGLFGGYSYHAAKSGEYVSPTYNTDNLHTLYFILGDSSGSSSYGVNGARKDAVTRWTTDMGEDDLCYIGILPGYSRPRARISSIRVYGRILSQEELEDNRAVDYERFVRPFLAGKTVHVSPTGNDTTGDGSKGNPYATITKGVSSCGNGDTLILLRGRHDRAKSEKNGVSVSKDIMIRGETDDPWETVVNINGGNAPVFVLNNRFATVRSLAVTNAVGSGAAGSALKVTAGCVTNCVICKCNSSGANGGAAVYADGRKAIVVDCVITNCAYNSGYESPGGVYLGGGAHLEHSLVAFCSATQPAVEKTGGVGGVKAANGFLKDCTIAACSGRNTGGLLLAAGSAERCIVAGNVSTGNDATFSDICPADVVRVTNSASSKNSSLDATCVTDHAVNFFRNLAAGDIRPAANPPVDYGYYPVDPAEPLVTIKLSEVRGDPPLTVSFVADTQGFAPGDDIGYAWDFGGGSSDDTAKKNAVATFDAGTYTVSLTVENRTTGETYTSVRTDAVTALPLNVFVQPKGATGFTPTPPYASWDTAAASLHDVEGCFADGVTIHLKEGLYETTNDISLAAAVTIRGAGLDLTTINNTQTGRNETYGNPYAKARVLTITHAGALVEGMTLSGGYAIKSTWGGGINMTMGTVSNCCVTANKLKGSGARGAGIYMTGGRVTHSKILSNTGSGEHYGGGIYAEGGVIDNCLIVGNYATYGGGGIYTYGPVRVLNCTIAENTSTYSGGGAGICVTSGYDVEIRNCLIANNINREYLTGAGPEWSVTGGKPAEQTATKNRIHNCAFGYSVDNPEIELPNATCRRFACAFTDADCHTSDIALIDAGTPYDDISSVDLDGNPRAKGESVDIGCYENQATGLAVIPAVSPAVAMVGSEIVFRADTLNEKPGSSMTFTWTLTGGEIPSSLVFCGREVTNVISYAGLLNVRLEAVDTAHSETAEPVYVPGALNIGAKTNYVVAVGTPGVVPRNPYSSWQTAATNIHDALAVSVSGSTLMIGPGTHPTTNLIAFASPRTVIGVEGAEVTTIRRVSPDSFLHSVFELDDPQAVLRGLCIRGGRTDATNNKGSGVRINSRGGVVEDCILTDNDVTTGVAWSGGGAVYMASDEGVVRRCRIYGNHSTGKSSSGAAVYMTKGTFENCIVSNNATLINGVVYATGGTVRNCTIVGNSCPGKGYFGGETKFVGGLYAKNARAVNVLCVGNEMTATAVSEQCQPDLVYANAENVVNCGVSARVTELPNNTCIYASGDALGFVDQEHGDYHLTRKSAFYKKGLYEAWMATAVDLDGQPRSRNPTSRRPRVDIGCYESELFPTGLSVLVR